MKFLLCLSLLAIPSMCGASIQFGGFNHVPVDWSTISTVTDEALGTASGTGINVTYDSVGDINATTTNRNLSMYAADTSFDALFYGTDVLQSLNIAAGAAGTSTFTFSRPVSSILLFLGAPGDDKSGSDTSVNPTNWNAAVWDFDAGLAVALIDGLRLELTSNELSRISVSDGNLVADGVVQITGPINSLSISQTSTGGLDRTDFAMAVAPIPEPFSFAVWGMLGAFAVCALRLRRTQS